MKLSKIQEILEDQDSFRHKLKNSANIYMKVQVHYSSELPLEHKKKWETSE